MFSSWALVLVWRSSRHHVAKIGFAATYALLCCNRRLSRIPIRLPQLAVEFCACDIVADMRIGKMQINIPKVRVRVRFLPDY